MNLYFIIYGSNEYMEVLFDETYASANKNEVNCESVKDSIFSKLQLKMCINTIDDLNV